MIADCIMVSVCIISSLIDAGFAYTHQITRGMYKVVNYSIVESNLSLCPTPPTTTLNSDTTTPTSSKSTVTGELLPTTGQFTFSCFQINSEQTYWLE